MITEYIRRWEESHIMVSIYKKTGDTFQCIIAELGRKYDKAIKRWSRYSWWWNRNWIVGSFKHKTQRFVATSNYQWAGTDVQVNIDIRIAQFCGRDESLHTDKQQNIRCYRMRIFTYWKKDINLYFCSAKWGHCKRQVCNCVTLNCVLVASRVAGWLIPFQNSTERGFIVVTVTRYLQESNIIFSA